VSKKTDFVAIGENAGSKADKAAELGIATLDEAALLALLRRRGCGGFEQIVIGAAEDEKMRAVMREVLAILAPDVPVLEQDDRSMWRFSELHYVQPVRRPPMFTLPEAIEAVRVAVLGDAPAPEAGGRRLFVSRRGHSRHRLENEAAVEAVLARHGFETVEPERLDVAGQAALFRSAAAIAGVKGAAFANLIFAPSDAAVLLLSPGDFADPFFLDIATARGMTYAELFGPLTSSDDLPAKNPFTIDPARLEAMLGALSGDLLA
jgi:capsular polysaccharide biosynthesis protein